MLKFCNVLNNTVLSAQFNGEKIYFIPRYLNCTNWKKDFEEFSNFLTDFKPNNFCIVGDLNARIGDQQVLDENLITDLPQIKKVRCSKDLKINTEGKKLFDLVEDIGGIILNGRTSSDKNGDFTFIGGRGNSVIDYIICSHSFLSFVENFSIGSKPYSDHMPLNLTIKISSQYSTSTKNALEKLRWNQKNIVKYRKNLSNIASNVQSENQISVDNLIISVTDKIKQANVSNTSKPFFEANQPWFDCKCARFRKKTLKKLSNYKKQYSDSNKKMYVSAKENYKQICSIKKLEYYNKNIEKLNKVKSSSEWWKLSNALKSQKTFCFSNLNSDDFFVHFSELLKIHVEAPVLSWCMPCTVNPILDSPIEYWELYSVVSKLNEKKAPGEDGICYEFYKYAPCSFLNETLNVFNKIFLHETIPDSFRTSILTPLYKKGDPLLPSNYRGLSLINTICKIFNSILLNRITFWLDRYNILNEFQAGFRKNYSTIDNIFNLTNIIEINKSQGKKTYAFFVDFSCAFDTIPRNCLFYKLSCLGLSSKIIRLLQASYTGTNSKVWDGSTFSNYFPVDIGVKQGCVLSPLLFSLFINDLAEVLPFGVNVAGVNVKVLLYADDIVVLADSPEDLQAMIDRLHVYCTTWSLSVNLSKSKVIVFRTGSRLSHSLAFKYGYDNIEILNSYKYLGVDITYNLSFKKHLQNKLSSAKLAINSTWSKYINHPLISKENKTKIFNAASRSIMFYAAQIWGFQKYDEVEKLLRFFVKKMLFLHKTTPNYVIHLETSMHSMFITTLQLHFSYIEKALNMGSQRLPNILANFVLEKKIYWAKEWYELCCAVELNPDNMDSSYDMCSSLIEKLMVKEKEEYITSARNSQSHDMYSKLQYNTIPSLIQNYKSWPSSLIIKARCGMLNINARSFLSNTTSICSICNLHAVENTLHFIGICPIYKSFRLYYFGKISLEEGDIICLLNGSDCYALYKYIEKCLNYRKLILNEFNSI